MTPKRRLAIRLDELLYDRLRRHASERRVSMSSIVREAVAASLAPAPPTRRSGDYPLVGLVGIASGTPLPGGRAVSEHHDEALAEAYSEGWRSWDDSAAPPKAAEGS